MGELTELNEKECANALHCFQVIQPYLEGQSALKAAAREQNIAYDTARC